MNTTDFIIVNFFVGFFSDIFLNVISSNTKYLQSLRKYFNNISVTRAAIYAGLTIVSALIPTMLIYKILTNKYVPKSNKDLIYFVILTFIIGYVYDILIEQYNVFPDLDEYYELYGAGFWGAFAFVFSVVISYLFLKYY